MLFLIKYGIIKIPFQGSFNINKEILHNMDKTQLERKQELEEVFRNNFYDMHRKAEICGNILREIKENELYTQSSFKSYCEDEWNITYQYANYLMNIAKLVGDTFEEGEMKPTVGSHIQELNKTREDLRRKVWFTARDRHGDKVTAKDIAKTREELETTEKIKDEAILKLVKNRVITPRHGYELQERLKSLPDIYYEAVAMFGITDDSCVGANTLKAIFDLQLSYKEEALSILRSGYMQTSNKNIPLSELTHSDVQRYHDYLKWEEKEQKVLRAKEKQKEEIKGPIVLEGSKIFDFSSDNPALVVYFPEGEVKPNQVADILTEKKLDTLMILAYTSEEEPDINFNGTKAKPSSINGVKPMWIMDMIKESTINE